jgi:hypothetical protein
VVVGSAARCASEILAFWACTEAVADPCAPGAATCTAENDAYAACILARD